MLHKSRRLFIVCCFMIAFISCGKAEDKVQEKETITNVPADDNSNSIITKAPQDTDDNTATEPVVTNSVELKAYAETYKETGELPSMAEVYKDKFRIGVALAQFDFSNPEKTKLVTSQFSSITCENEMKPDFTLDRAATLATGDEECPVVNMKNADTALAFAKENGIKMRGHTLVWQNQTPRWLFTVGYSDASDAPLVTKEVMLARMENYIRQEMEYVNSNYPGVIYAWDVVNEAIEPGDGQEHYIRTKNNLWYEVIGEDYIEMAFTYARKYAALDQKLFYNDYGTYEKSKLFPICDMISKLKEKNIIDGIGMQDHMSIDYPSILDYQYAINKYAELGIEIQVTELDINTTDNSEKVQQKLASRYKLFMTILMKCIEKKNANITSITFWGLSDDRSWLNNSKSANYPLLFDKDLKPKPAFFGFLQDNSISINSSITPTPQPTLAAKVTSTPIAEAEQEEITGEANDEIFSGKDTEYKTMIEKSLISTGNNYRIKKAMEKAQKGEEVTIAYIGGSITEGAGATTSEGCYAYQSYLYFKDTFGAGDGSNVKFVNTGMGGTPSTLGIIRYDRDVTAYGQVEPDIVFIEFAVNDYQEPTHGEAYESLIRKVLSADNQPAVILLFSVFKSRWNMQDLYKPLGTAYNLPMISVRDGVVPELEAGHITDAKFFFDDFHPTDFGHGIMADCVKYYYGTVNTEPTAVEDIKVPNASYIGKSFVGIKMIDSQTVDGNVSITPGDFNDKDTQLCRFATKELTFPNNWRHSSANGSDSFVMKLNCKNLIFVYKSCSDKTFGAVDVYVDGKIVTNIVSSQGGGWTNPVPVLLIKDDKATNHTIEIKMAEGNQEKVFSILAFGYTQ